MRFVDVKNDVAFHRIFGNAQKTSILISFLNATLCLEGSKRIVRVKIENPYLFPPSHGGKSSVLDIRATDGKGRHFIVEMQVADHEGFEKRAQFYAARDYATQIDSGQTYALLRPTYFVGILNFRISATPHYYSHHQTINTVSGECLLKDIQYFFIELPKFNKKIDELQNMIDMWTFFIKNAENLEIIPSVVQDEGLKTAYIEADKHNWTKAELNAYIDAGVQEADQILAREKAEKMGHEKGVEVGRQEGIKVGRQEGIKVGRQEGIEVGRQEGIEVGRQEGIEVGRQEERTKGELEKEQREIALIMALYKDGMPIERIAQFSTKTTDEIQRIISQN